MFCLKCGKEIADDAMRCPFCDCPTENAGEMVDTTAIDPTVKTAKSFGITAIILGALGILWAWLLAIFGWGLSGAGLVVGLVGRNKNKYVTSCKVGIILSSIGIACSFISSLIGMLIMM